jgi:hypothetical protein
VVDTAVARAEDRATNLRPAAFQLTRDIMRAGVAADLRAGIALDMRSAGFG